jgi:putative tryptophan/tyrosine transport system substrate-binding protein
MTKADSRRAILATACAVCLPLLHAAAQTPRSPVRIGWLVPDVPVPGEAYHQFVRRAVELGYAEGTSLLIDYRSFQTLDEGKAAAAALVRLKVDLLVAQAPPALLAARSATQTVPIVAFFVGDPVHLGVVSSLARPGGNITGFTWDTGSDGTGKALEILKEMLPRASRVGLLWNVENDSHPVYIKDFESHAPRLKLSIVAVGVRRVEDFEPALRTMKTERVDAAILFPDPFTVRHRESLSAALARHPMPAMWGSLAWPLRGALVTFGADVSDQPRRAAEYVDRILKGVSPGTLPFQQPSRSDLVIDVDVARALGVTPPRSLLVRADKVIGQ